MILYDGGFLQRWHYSHIDNPCFYEPRMITSKKRGFWCLNKIVCIKHLLWVEVDAIQQRSIKPLIMHSYESPPLFHKRNFSNKRYHILSQHLLLEEEEADSPHSNTMTHSADRWTEYVHSCFVIVMMMSRVFDWIWLSYKWITFCYSSFYPICFLIFVFIWSQVGINQTGSKDCISFRQQNGSILPSAILSSSFCALGRSRETAHSFSVPDRLQETSITLLS